ncbi:MAG: hypothetical protein LBV23_04475 [Deltaproteobacteria bacterium]|nr:hypothetical protein [Deltaproteobacteria bacterium]
MTIRVFGSFNIKTPKSLITASQNNCCHLQRGDGGNIVFQIKEKDAINPMAKPRGLLARKKMRELIKREPLYRLDSGFKPGAILVMALVILGLISLTGVFLLSSARKNLAVSVWNREQIEALNSAETATQISILLTRALSNPDLGYLPKAILTSKSGSRMAFEVKIKDELFDLEHIRAQDDSKFEQNQRYLEVIGALKGDEPPALLFKIGDTIVAAASITEESEPLGAGYPLILGDGYDPANGAMIEFNIIVTVSGAPYENVLNKFEAPQTLITAIYRYYR